MSIDPRTWSKSQKIVLGSVAVGLVAICCFGCGMAAVLGDKNEPNSPANIPTSDFVTSEIPPASPTVYPTPTVVESVVAPVTTTPVVQPEPEVYYANCSEVRAAGEAPLHRGDPGYRSGLDRDGDGVACE